MLGQSRYRTKDVWTSLSWYLSYFFDGSNVVLSWGLHEMEDAQQIFSLNATSLPVTILIQTQIVNQYVNHHHGKISNHSYVDVFRIWPARKLRASCCLHFALTFFFTLLLITTHLRPIEKLRQINSYNTAMKQYSLCLLVHDQNSHNNFLSKIVKFSFSFTNVKFYL